MGLLSFFNKSRPPAAFTFPTLVVASAAHIAAAENLLTQLQKKFGDLGLAVTAGAYRGPLPWSSLPNEQARHDLYGCADFVVAGATLEPGTNQPDIVTPLLYAQPLIVGPAGRQSSLVRAALAAKALWSAENSEQIFQHTRYILQNPEAAKVRAEAGRAWLLGQPRASERILELIQ